MGKIKMPSGIPYIVGNETAERFSYYGMKTILIIFMTEYLRMPENQANEWYHLFGSAVYAFPLLGALVADMFFWEIQNYFNTIYCVLYRAFGVGNVRNT